MTAYQAGDLVLVQFPQTSGATGTLRPALVLLDIGDADVVVSRVTRQMHASSHDIDVTDWKGAGLLAPSFVRLHKIATLEKKSIQRKLGSLQAADRAKASSILQQIFGTW
jgi:mRNA interferase MazF